MTPFYAMEPLALRDFESRREAALRHGRTRAIAPRRSSAGTPARVVGSTAIVPVVGVLLPQRDWLLEMFGVQHTSYADLAAQLRAADADADVTRIVLEVSSPGGAVQGLFPLLREMASIRTPMVAHVYDLAASAAYAIASQASRIEVEGPWVAVGSIGVAASFFVDSRVVWVTSTDSPAKRPDVSTPDGQAVVRRELDDIHGLFVAEIARGRRTTPAKVNATYGRGSVLLASDARAAGMIDSSTIVPVLPPPAPLPAIEASAPPAPVVHGTDRERFIARMAAATEPPGLTDAERGLRALAIARGEVPPDIAQHLPPEPPPAPAPAPVQREADLGDRVVAALATHPELRRALSSHTH